MSRGWKAPARLWAPQRLTPRITNRLPLVLSLYSSAVLTAGAIDQAGGRSASLKLVERLQATSVCMHLPASPRLLLREAQRRVGPAG